MSRRISRKLALTGAAATVFGATLVVTSAPAYAGGLGCNYPSACLYNASEAKIGDFKVVTSGYQTLYSTNVYYGVNTRNDDVVYIRYTNGDEACMGSGNPNLVWNLRAFGVPNGIRISSESVCWASAPHSSGTRHMLSPTP